MTGLLQTSTPTLCPASCPGRLTFMSYLLGFFTSWFQVGFGHWEAPVGNWRSEREWVGYFFIALLYFSTVFLPVTAFPHNYSFYHLTVFLLFQLRFQQLFDKREGLAYCSVDYINGQLMASICPSFAVQLHNPLPLWQWSWPRSLLWPIGEQKLK